MVKQNTPAKAGAATVSQNVAEIIEARIVEGRYPPGLRLPPERELAAELGASRATLREALSVLAGRNLLRARQGSGVTVQPRTEWGFDVLPSYVRHALPTMAPSGIGPFVADILGIRRGVFMTLVRIGGPRMGSGELTDVRALLHQAWEAREDGARFVMLDFEMVRAVAAASDFPPITWLLNTIGGVYRELALGFAGAVMVPEDYVAVHEAYLDAMERKDAAEAERVMSAYLERFDAELVTLLEAAFGAVHSGGD